MQRLYLEWTLHRFVTVRGGQFLTPFGIWNVDHGSPVYIPVQRPYIVNSNSSYFPERQTGLELLGRWDISNRSSLGYHLTLSNGGGSVSEYRDFDRTRRSERGCTSSTTAPAFCGSALRATTAETRTPIRARW